MNKLILILSVVFVVIPLNYCFGNSRKSTTDIEGLWIKIEKLSQSMLDIKMVMKKYMKKK